MIEKKKRTEIITPEKALLKARAYCAYQERCQQEVRDKLYEWEQRKTVAESIIVQLITENFINEERYAIVFAGGKFRIKKWGRIKIKLALKKHHISEYCIQKALSEIDNSDYVAMIRKIILQKVIEKKQKYSLKQQYRIAQYLISKGFESDIVWEEMRNCLDSFSDM